MNEEQWVDIAYAKGPWSIRGHIKIHPLCDWDTLQKLTHWRWVSATGSSSQELKAIEKRYLDGKLPAIRFAGINNRDMAQSLKGGRFCVPASQLPELKKEEYYWKDLFGLIVENCQGERLGLVKSVQENLANAYIEIEPASSIASKKNFNVPFVKNYIIEVNIADKKIIIDWAKEWID